MPRYTLAELCEQLGAPFEGNGSTVITGVAEITSAENGDLSFVANPKYVSKIPHCKASAMIVPVDLTTDFQPVIRSSNPYLTFTQALHLFHKDNRKLSGGVHPSSQIGEHVQVGKDITIMPHAIIEDHAEIGNRVVIYPGVYVGEGVRIGDDVILYPNVSIYTGCLIESQCILHAGCRIGAITLDSAAHKTPPVTLEADVELGANVVISGSYDSSTRIGEGTKIDNLVQIGVGTTLGPHCIIVAQVTIGDHVVLKERVTVAGQVVISPGITIGELARIGAKSVIEDDVPPDSDYWGVPAQPHTREKRMKANIARLPRLFQKIQTIEDQLSKSE